ncbi:hypothetical protein ACWGR4_46950 [Embleya sp. NPDC055664]
MPIPDTTTELKVIDDHQRERAVRGLAKRKVLPPHDRVILVLGFTRRRGKRPRMLA